MLVNNFTAGHRLYSKSFAKAVNISLHYTYYLRISQLGKLCKKSGTVLPYKLCLCRHNAVCVVYAYSKGNDSKKFRGVFQHFTVVCYFVIRLINRFTNKDKGSIEICKIKIINNDNYCQFYGKIDTGNTLCEPFSQYPVIVASEDAVKPVAEEAFSNLLTYSEPDRVLKHKYRLVPYTSIGGSGLLPAFLPKEVYINDNYCPQKVYIAVCKSNVLKGEIKAMVNPEIIEYVKDDYCDIGKIV